MVSTTVAWPQPVTATFLQAGKWKSSPPDLLPLHTAALAHNHPFFWIKHHCHILSPWTKTQKWIGSDSFSHTFSIKVEIKSRSKLDICPQSTASYKEQIGLKLIIYWREENCHLLFYNLLPRVRHRSGRWAGTSGCVNGFGHYQYFGRGWGVQGQSGHLDTRTLALFILFAITY